jgi:hypothetical protein
MLFSLVYFLVRRILGAGRLPDQGSDIELLVLRHQVKVLQRQAKRPACAVETVFLKTLYVLFFIELQTRRVHVMGATAHPDSRWITQQARNLLIEGRLGEVGFLVRDRDAKFSGPFDEVFRTEGVRVIRTPIRAPRANAFAERFVRTVRHEWSGGAHERPSNEGTCWEV